MYVSIRTKILAVLSVLLVGAILAYLLLADRIFREDKQLLVFDTNRSNAERLADNLEASIQRVLDKTGILAQLALGGKASSQHALARDFFLRDSEMIYFGLLQLGRDQKPHVVEELFDAKQLAGMGLKDDTVRPPLGSAPAQVSLENVSVPGAILYLLSVPVELRSGAGAKDRFYAQVVVDGRNWVDAFLNETLSYNFAVTASGVALAYPDTKALIARKSLASHELVKAAQASSLLSRQVEFEQDHTSYLGVYRKVNIGGVTVFSVMAKSAALSASLLLLEKTIVLSLIVVTTALLVGLWFARSLSLPLLQLVRASGEIAKGRFDTRIKVDSRDEIGALAQAFDRMARDLKTSRLQLEDYSRSLEAKVQERTQELETKNAAIRSQQDMLVRTTRLAAVGEIAGQAAHEVLNPLTGMIARLEAVKERMEEFRAAPGGAVKTFDSILAGWRKDLGDGGIEAWSRAMRGPSHVLKGKTLAEEDLMNLEAGRDRFLGFADMLKEDVQLMLNEAFRISRIVDSMRGLSRMSQIKARVDLRGLVTECVRTNEDLLAKHKIRISSELREPLSCEIDSDEMRQVLSNLVKNAMDAIEEKRHAAAADFEARIEFSGQCRDGKVVLRVRDNGGGISHEDWGRIFEPDFSTKGSEGTGFGLSICRRLIRSAGGELTVADSRLGQFTEFEIVLPEARHG